jgi:hypothetical protein
MAESGHVLIESTILSFAWRNEENHENLSQGSQSAEPGSSQIQSRSHSATTLGV